MTVFDPSSIVPPIGPCPHPEVDMTWWHGPASDLEGLSKKTLKALQDLYDAAHPESAKAEP